MAESADQKLKKAHVRLMKNRLTAPYIGAIMLGESTVVEGKEVFTDQNSKKNAEGNKGHHTARTNGIDKQYDREWVESLPMTKLCGAVLHENLHVFLKQIIRHQDLARENPHLLNASMDLVTNDMIMQIKEQDPLLVDLPDGGLWHPKFRNWSVREVYNFLKSGKNNQGQQEGQPKAGQGCIIIGKEKYNTEGHDEHDNESIADATPQQVQEMLAKISDAIHQGGLLAGRMGMEIPRAFKDAMEPEVDWVEEMREFISNATRGTDEFTFRKYNKRRVADDYYLPSTESETISEVIVAIDTSGSIGEKELSEFAGELASICDLTEPERVRVLWWDTKVHGEQVFNRESQGQIKKLLKPLGGGGTHAGCVSDYLKKKKIDADCVVVFTDGYVEHDVLWEINTPTMWMVTVNHSFTPPMGGKMIKYKSKL
jgi:predicted metal-dependent peptidase